jgi:hypothetical protein
MYYLIHNVVFIVVTLILYITFAVISGLRMKRIKETGKLRFNKAQKRSFIQVALISLLNTAGALVSSYLISDCIFMF